MSHLSSGKLSVECFKFIITLDCVDLIVRSQNCDCDQLYFYCFLHQIFLFQCFIQHFLLVFAVHMWTKSVFCKSFRSVVEKDDLATFVFQNECLNDASWSHNSIVMLLLLVKKTPDVLV